MRDFAQRIMEVPPYLKAKDVKTYFGIAERKVWDHIAHKKFVASKDGKHWIVSTASIFKYIKAQQNIHKGED